MTDRYAKKRAAILAHHHRDAWHWRADGTLWVRNTATGVARNLGHVDPGPHRTPRAMPAIRKEVIQ